jgi:hypothetical protein
MPPPLTSVAQEAYDQIRTWFPPILTVSKLETIDWLIELQMAHKGTTTGELEMVVSAGRLVSRPSAKARFDKLLGIEVPRTEAKAPYESLDGYLGKSCTVRRWTPIPFDTPKGPAETKVLGLCGSNRIGGNTDLLIDEVLRGASEAGAEIEKIQLSKINIKRCENRYMQRDFFSAKRLVPELEMEFCVHSRELNSPEDRGYCVLADDMPELYRRIQSADAVVVGFPCINGWEGDILTAFQERWQRYEGCQITDRIELGRRGMVIGTWGTNDIQAYDNNVEYIINKLTLRGFPVVEALSACGFAGMLSGIDTNLEGLIKRFPEETAHARAAGRHLVLGGDA